MRSLSSPIHIRWFAGLLAFTFLLLAHASTDQGLGGEKSGVATGQWLSEAVWSNKGLAGAGSSPPNCVYKCGSCSPCVPVLVSLPPAGITPPQYKHQVWRCKCGEELFNP